MTTIWTAGHRDKQPLLLAHCLVNAGRAQVKSPTGIPGHFYGFRTLQR